LKQILVDINKCLACKSCEIACAVTHSGSKDLYGAVLQERKPKQRVYVEAGDGLSFPLQCRQCEEPRCVQACMSGAMFRDTESGLVQNNSDKCVGCWMCVMVCPFGAIIQDTEEKKAIKCDRCMELEVPACVQACPTKAIKFTQIDDYSRAARKQYLTNFQISEEVK